MSCGLSCCFAVLADRLAQFMHYFTLYASLRPFGASAVVAGYDPFSGVHELYMVEPSGTNYVSETIWPYIYIYIDIGATCTHHRC